MTIYQQELLRKLSQLGCAGEFDEESGILHISVDGVPLCLAGKKAELYWNQNKGSLQEYGTVIDALLHAAKSIREYVDLYEAAPSLGVDGLPEYRRLAEYGDVVLGAMYSEPHGFMFVTWRQDKEKSYVTQGDYTPDYEYAKKSFIVRSRLADENRLFTPEEAENLYRCIGYVRENCGTLTCEQEQQLKALAEKLTYGYPQLENSPASFEQEDSLQLNM